MKILYFNNSAFGGLAQYAHHQANSLVDAGCEVDFLCPPNYPEYADCRYNPIRTLSSKSKRTGASRFSRLRGFYKEVTSDIQSLVYYAENNQISNVLFGSYLEYFSPFWVGSLLKLKKKGIVFGSVVHDPIRDTKLGPSCWHRHSVKKAYEFLDLLFLHQKIKDPLSGLPSSLPQFVIPHGPYPVNASLLSRSEAREKLKLPQDKTVLLSFGHIRDNKNLNLAIESLQDHPEFHLVIAGQSLNETQKQPEYYKELARQLKVEDRVTWFIEYIPDDQISSFFSASDGILLTYSRGFRSASGVLNIASTFDKPCIASSGPSPLKDLVNNYSLGVWVDPDDKGALSKEMREFKKTEQTPDWGRYRKDNSWERNAKITKEAFLKHIDNS
jgi:glycosyltransferase involved in cell wall biosynthesis